MVTIAKTMKNALGANGSFDIAVIRPSYKIVWISLKKHFRHVVPRLGNIPVLRNRSEFNITKIDDPIIAAAAKLGGT